MDGSSTVTSLGRTTSPLPLLPFSNPPSLLHRPLPPRRISLCRRLRASAPGNGLGANPIEPVLSAGGGGEGKSSGGAGSGGGGGEGDGEEEEKKMSGLSMSQKLTLGYAALVGVGGAMGYLKTGSGKSLIAGGSSALLLYYVHTQLPSNPVLASSLGLGISAALLAVMGSRFKRSGKIFPAGVVSLVSLIMTGGYIHGIARSLH